MPTRNVVITAHQAELIDRLVTSGRYQNASEVLREGLRLIEERDKEHAAKVKTLREAAQVGIDDAEAGRYTELRNPAEIRRHLRGIADEVLGRRRRAK